MATLKYTPAISISQIASYMAKLTNNKNVGVATDLPSLQDQLNRNSGELETPLPGLGNGVQVLTERINVRAALFSMSPKTKLMDAVMELEDLAFDDYTPSNVDTWVPLLVCDDTLSGIDSLFVVYGVTCDSGYDTMQICKMFMKELTSTLYCEAMPTVLSTCVPIKVKGHVQQYLTVMAVHAKSLIQ